MYSALNLDFYGTLVDWIPAWNEISTHVVSNSKLSPVEFTALWRKKQRQYAMRQQFMPYKEQITTALKHVCNENGLEPADYAEQLFENWKKIQPFPEANTILKNLKRKYRLAICTNSSKDLLDICLQKIQVKFDAITISDEEQASKPNAKIYFASVKKLNLPKEKIIHVASSKMDLKGATEFGFDVYWVNRLGENSEIKPKFQEKDLKELLPILE